MRSITQATNLLGLFTGKTVSSDVGNYHSHQIDDKERMIAANITNKVSKIIKDKKYTVEIKEDDPRYEYLIEKSTNLSLDNTYQLHGMNINVDVFDITNRDRLYQSILPLVNSLGITNLQPAVIKHNVLFLYSFLVYRHGQRKAGKLLNRLIKLDLMGETNENARVTDHSDLKFYGSDLFLGRILKADILKDPLLNKTLFINQTLEYLSSNRAENQYLEMQNSYNGKRYYEIRSEYRVDRDLSIHESLVDSSVVEGLNQIRSSRLFILINYMEYDLLTELLDMLIARSDVDLHDFVERLTNGTFDRIAREGRPYQERVVKFIRRLKRVNRESFLKIIEFMNYQRVYRASNIAIMEDNINYIMAARRARSTNEGATYKRVPSGMLFDDQIYVESLDGRELSKEVIVTKDINEVNTIGTRTLCCFTPSGLARSLVKTAVNSPLAAIVEGKINGGRATWFSFIWEMMNIDDSGLFRASLILDNVEASQSLDEETFNRYVDYMRQHSGYKQFYLGTARNDIKVSQEHLPPRLFRPRTLINFESSFDSYSYDDSREIYNVNDYQDYLVDNFKISNINIKRVTTIGEFHRLKSVEKLVWGNRHDVDLHKIDFKLSPVYLIMGDDDVVLGYLVTRLVEIEDDGSVNFNYLNKGSVKNILNNKTTKLGLLFEDIYTVNNRNAVATLGHVFNDLINYVQANNIEYTVASPNKMSNSFIKRAKQYTTYIDDTRFGESIEDHIEPSMQSRKKISNNVFNGNLQVNDLLKSQDAIELGSLVKVKNVETTDEKEEEDNKLNKYSLDNIANFSYEY